MPKILLSNTEYDYDEALSFKDFTSWEFTSRPEYSFSDKVIYASCFSQEVPRTVIFPENMTGATFVKCNLDNVLVPEGNVVIECSTRNFEVQNDGNDWEVDEEGNPVRPIDYQIFEKQGLSVPTPDEIPAEESAVAVNWIESKKEEKLQVEKEEIKLK